MDICLDDTTSLLLMRAVAMRPDLELVPSALTQAVAPAARPCKLERLGMPALLSYLRVPETRQLGLVVPRSADRIRTQGIRCTVRSCLRGNAPFLQLCSANPDEPSALVPARTHVFVQSPANVVLSMAQRLRRMETVKKMGHHQAVLMLVKLCLELCGTYAHDPFDPINGDVTYDVMPATNGAELREVLELPGAERGLSLAREAAALTYDLSGSPQESCMGPALFFATSLGGLALCDFEANKPLRLTSAERAAIGNRTITPDFTLMDYRSVVEYLGSIHAEGQNPRIDHRRSLDYQTLGLREFGFWYDDVRSQGDFMRSAARIVTAIEQFDGPDARRRFQRLASDLSFCDRQGTLFRVFRPWLRGRSWAVA